MATDLIARGLAAGTRDGALPTLASFADLATRTIPSAVVRIDAGSGVAHGSYLADQGADGALANAHPLFCRADAAGRYFRLLPDGDGLIPVACGGAQGQVEAIDDSSIDDRPAIQAAENYRHAIAAAGIRLDARRYAARRTPRDAGAPNDIHPNKSGLLFRCQSSSIWKATHPEGTDIHRRRTNGQAMALTEFQWMSAGYAWRGGGIFTDGQSSDPGDPAVGSLTLDGVRLQGGLTYTGIHSPTDQVTGDGWDVSDKGIWQANDRYCGHVTLRNGAGIVGFLGELIYTSGAAGATRSSRFLTIDDSCVLGESNGSCINANGVTLRVGRCYCYNSYIGIEGWTGEEGGYLETHFRNCITNSLQGGTVNTSGTGGYYDPVRPTPTRVPLGRLDVLLEKAGAFNLGHWLTGRIEAIDSSVVLGNTGAFANGSKELDLEIVSWVDQTGSSGAVAILGGGPGAMSTARASIRLSCKRTAYAIANNLRHQAAVYTYGSLGPDVLVEFRAFEGVAGPLVYAAASYDYRITIRNYAYDVFTATGSGYFNIEANAGGELPLFPAVALACSNNGVYACTLPITGINTGTEMVVANFTNNFVSGGAALRLSNAGGLRQSGDLILPPGFNIMRLVFDGAKWTTAEPPPPLAATAGWNPAAIPTAGQVTTTVPVIGASVGDKVDAGFSADLQGLVLTGYVSAPGTVTASLANLTGASVDLPAGTLSVTVSP